jgi:hypothetical protein
MQRLKANPSIPSNFATAGIPIKIFNRDNTVIKYGNNQEVRYYTGLQNIELLFDSFVALNSLPKVEDNESGNKYLHLKNIYYIKFAGLGKTSDNKEYYLSADTNNNLQLIPKGPIETDTESFSRPDCMWIFHEVQTGSKCYIIINFDRGLMLQKAIDGKLELTPSSKLDADSENMFYISKNFCRNNNPDSILLFSNIDLTCLGSLTSTGASFFPLGIYNNNNECLPDFNISIHRAPDNIVNTASIYAPLIYCCGNIRFNTTSGLGAVLNAFENQGNKDRICGYMNISGNTTQTEAVNCNTSSENICGQKFTGNTSKPILKSTDPEYKEYIEWYTMNSPEGKICQCFAPISYYRTKYKQELNTYIEDIKTNPTYEKYYNFFSSQIDNFVYKRYPLSEDEKKANRDLYNPFLFGSDTNLTPARCYNDTCVNGFKPFPNVEDDRKNIKLTLPLYKKTLDSNIDECGSVNTNQVTCNQFVLNIIEKENSISLDTNQYQQCGFKQGDSNPLYIHDLPFTCNESTGERSFLCLYDDSQNTNNLNICKDLFIAKNYPGNDKIIVERDTQSRDNNQINGRTMYKYIAKNIPCENNKPEQTPNPLYTPSPTSKRSNIIIYVIIGLIAVLVLLYFIL